MKNNTKVQPEDYTKVYFMPFVKRLNFKCQRKGEMMPVQYSGYINERYSTEFKNINKELVDWLEKTSLENNCRVDRKEWKSKYNSYVVYDYEPFCSDGFEINMVVSSYDVNYLNFLKFLFENKIKTIEYLKGCMTA